MARMTVYIPDELKARMDEAGPDSNWSEIAQRAFEASIGKPEAKSDHDLAYWSRFPAPAMNISGCFVIDGGRRYLLTDLIADQIREAIAAQAVGKDPKP